MAYILSSRARCALLAVAAGFMPLAQQAQAPAEMGAESGATQQRILLVLPFDNLTGTAPDPGMAAAPEAAKPATSSASNRAAASPNPASPNPAGADSSVADSGIPDPASLDWIREAAPGILNARFTSAGFFPLTRDDRLYALDHLGLPETFQPSRATALKIAETLDANYVLFGSYRVEGGRLILKARIVDVARLRLSDQFVETGPLAQLIPILNSLAWQLTRHLDPGFDVAQETFRAASSGLRLDAFEQYIRGLTEPDSAERLRHLRKATELYPGFTEAWLATAKLEFASQEYEEAAVSFAKVTRNAGAPDPDSLEAGFYRGLALIYSGNYAKAEEDFAAVARVLPLPEVVNNQAVAISRRSREAAAAVALFRQAAAADPTDADYHFNLAVSLHRHGDAAESLSELAECLQLRPNDSEARSTQEAWKRGAGGGPAPGADPLERIKRGYDGAAFRQAARMMEQVEQARLAALPPTERAVKLNALAHATLDRGLLLDAERGFQAALAADPLFVPAHTGLAQVRERSGDLLAARKEAEAALATLQTDSENQNSQTAYFQARQEAYLVLARIDFAANRLMQARDEVEAALRIDPASRAARELRKSIESHVQASPAARP